MYAQTVEAASYDSVLLNAKKGGSSASRAIKNDSLGALIMMDKITLVPMTGWENFTTYLRLKLFPHEKKPYPEGSNILIVMALDDEGRVTFADLAKDVDSIFLSDNLRKVVSESLKNGPRWLTNGQYKAGSVAVKVYL